MINLEEVIRQLGQEALRLQLEESEKDDTAALLALENKTMQGRSEAIRKWLQGYQVFQGIPGPKRIAIAASVVECADTRDKQRDLTTISFCLFRRATTVTHQLGFLTWSPWWYKRLPALLKHPSRAEPHPQAEWGFLNGSQTQPRSRTAAGQFLIVFFNT